MARSALKPVFYILFGVALGWGIGRVQGWSDGTGGRGGRRPVPAEQGGYSAGQDGGPAGSKSHAHEGEARAKPGPERLERLASEFRSKKSRIGKADEINLIGEITQLSKEELSGVNALLAGEEIDWRTTQLLMIRWATLEPKAALAFAMEQPKFSGDANLVTAILGELAKEDLPAAKTALARLDGKQRSYGGQVIVEQLMEKDIRTALACARELENEDAETMVMRNWTRTDLAAAAEELTLGQVKDPKVVEEIAGGMMGKDKAAFEAWTERLANPAHKAVARRVALTVGVEADPKGAALATAAWLASDPEASAQAGGLPGQIVQRLVRVEGGHAEAAAWAASLPQGQARDSAIIESGRLWIEQDIMQASAWLGSLPQSSGKDAAVLYLVEKITGETPADAFEWARTVKTPALRKKALRKVADNWTGQDPAAARQALEILSAADRSSLREPEKPE